MVLKPELSEGAAKEQVDGSRGNMPRVVFIFPLMKQFEGTLLVLHPPELKSKLSVLFSVCADDNYLSHQPVQISYLTKLT